jgi:putative transposase
MISKIYSYERSQVAFAWWREDYQHRPHSALGNITPAEFATKSTLEKQAA